MMENGKSSRRKGKKYYCVIIISPTGRKIYGRVKNCYSKILNKFN